MVAKTFILGAGAQKAGTTWLHRYLKSKGNVNLGFRKEYHVWDAMTVPECKDFQVPFKSTLRDNIARRRWLMQRSPRYYFGYFSSLLQPHHIEITGDITPSYSSLDRSVFGEIKRGFKERNIRTKVIFLMRDPVDRCASALSMGVRNGKIGKKNDYTEDLILLMQSRSYEIRTNYLATIAEIEATFDPEDIFIGIYEEMFSEEGVEKISNFIGVELDFSFTEKVVNASVGISYDKKAACSIVERYSDVYHFARERFPQVDVLWPNMKYL